jgi:tRNA pseudouridine38/39 synthase
LGKNYNGFEHHANNKTPLPTIEEELWKALNKARLIFPKGSSPLHPGEVNWDGCEFSKCGRTDKGVSAFGQVIGIRVRSNRPLGKRRNVTLDDEQGNVASTDFFNTYMRDNSIELASPALSPSQDHGRRSVELSLNDEDYEDALLFDPIVDEIPYPTLLNKLLPPDIRVLAWCPAPPLGFSARFSCKERQYRYFFTQPAFAPAPAHLESKTNIASGLTMEDGWLNIEAMREAAQHFVGVHDFRNFCKIDPSKQLTNFERRIYHADIVEVEDKASALGFVDTMGPFASTSLERRKLPKVYSFDLHGTAFLWHQVRHMVSILFLVGQGLEKPSIVSELLDIEKTPCRPMYEMATDTPLVLWNCVFPRVGDSDRDDALQWLYIGDQAGKGDDKYGSMSLMDDLWKVWRERKIDEILAGTLVDVVASQGNAIETLTTTPKKGIKSQRVFDGGDVPRLKGAYIPVAEMPQLESPDEINKKYALRKGFESAELRAQGFRKFKISSSVEDINEYLL